MILALAPDILYRLADIEAAEGIPPVELVHQAVAIWSALDAEERRILGIAAMRLVASRLHGGVR